MCISIIRRINDKRVRRNIRIEINNSRIISKSAYISNITKTCSSKIKKIIRSLT